MQNPVFPEDSMLKRHFDSAIEQNRLAWLQTPPSDSVLRRHFNASMNSSTSKVSTPRATVAASPRPSSTTNETMVQAKGFFGWLRNLFS